MRFKSTQIMEEEEEKNLYFDLNTKNMTKNYCEGARKKKIEDDFKHKIGEWEKKGKKREKEIRN